MWVFLGFVRKEALHVLRDRRTLLVLFGLPLVEMILFGYALRNEVENAPVAIVDTAGTPLSREVIAALEASPSFAIVGIAPSSTAAEAWLRDASVRLVVVLDQRLGELRLGDEARYQLLVDGSDPNTARTTVAYATAVIESTLARSVAAAAGGRGLPRVEPEIHMAFNPGLDSAYLFIPGLMALVLTLVSALMTSVTIAREKELGTMEVLLASPLRPLQIVAGKVVPYFVLSIANVALILILSRFAFEVPVRGSLTLLIVECLLFTVCALSLGVLVSAKATTQQAATTASMSSLMFPTIMLSGFIFPLASLPVVLQWLSVVVPARWFVEIVRGIMLKGLGLDELWQPTLVLVAMTVVVLSLSLRSFRLRLE